jgi:hypothetical protein
MPPGQSKVELYAALRRDSRAGLSDRALERKYGVGWRTVQQALSSAWPRPRRECAPRRSKLDPFKPVVDEILLVDLDAPRKQWRTATRIEAGRRSGAGFRPAVASARAEAEVDFGEVMVAAARRTGDLHVALSAVVVLGQGCAPGLRLRRVGGHSSKVTRTLQRAGRGAVRQDPLRQSEGRLSH